jgi:hypothetical protein
MWFVAKQLWMRNQRILRALYPPRQRDFLVLRKLAFNLSSQRGACRLDLTDAILTDLKWPSICALTMEDIANTLSAVITLRADAAASPSAGPNYRCFVASHELERSTAKSAAFKWVRHILSRAMWRVGTDIGVRDP